MRRRLWIGMVGICLAMVQATGCASPKPAPQLVLDPPPNAVEEARVLLVEGNQLFTEGRWEPARRQFQGAIERQSDLAEAHYNLALSLERLGDRANAKKHYIEAANLAPGHKVIWDSPPLRRFGNVPDAPYETGATPGVPGVGGMGGGMGGFGGGGMGGPMGMGGAY
jgi:hypothetical protein